MQMPVSICLQNVLRLFLMSYLPLIKTKPVYTSYDYLTFDNHCMKYFNKDKFWGAQVNAAFTY